VRSEHSTGRNDEKIATGAWIAWLLAAMTPALTTRHPVYLLALLVIAIVLLSRSDHHDPQTRDWGVFLRFGISLAILSALLNALLAHNGETVLLTIPAEWPAVGGPIALEGVVFGLISGLALTTLLVIVTVFNTNVDSYRLVRLAPRFLFQAGVAASIALAFVPQTVASLQEIRQAQMLRGHRFRGLRDLLPLVVPLLNTGLERAIQLAESMESRGYGAAYGTKATGLLPKLLALVGSFLLIGGLFLNRYFRQQAIAGLLLMLAGAALLLVALGQLGHHVRRTQYRHDRWQATDRLILTASLVSLGLWLLLLMLQPDTATYEPYPRLSPPAVNGLWIVALLPLLLPALAHRLLTDDNSR